MASVEQRGGAFAKPEANTGSVQPEGRCHYHGGRGRGEVGCAKRGPGFTETEGLSPHWGKHGPDM